METLLERKTEETDSSNYTHKVKIVEHTEYIVDVICSDEDQAISEAETMLDTTFPKDGMQRREWREAEIVDIRE